VLTGLRLESLELLTPRQYERLAENGGLSAYDVIVMDGYAPPEGLMPPGRYLTFGSAPPVEGLNQFGTTDRQIVLNLRDEHPALQFVRMDEVYIASAYLLQPDETVDVLVEGSAGPVIVAYSRGPMQVLHVAFDPARSTWPLVRSWVNFVFNAVDYLGHVGEGLTAQGRRVGEALTARLPASATDVELLMPDGTSVKLAPPDPAVFNWGPIRLAGLYLLSYGVPGAEEPQVRSFAVNLLSESEGRLAPVETIEIGQEKVAGTFGGGASYTPLWPWAIGLCLFVLMLEWWVYHRRAFI